MGLMDDMKTRAGDMMNDPETRAKIQKIADEKGISMEEAQKHFMKKQDGQA